MVYTDQAKSVVIVKSFIVQSVNVQSLQGCNIHPCKNPSVKDHQFQCFPKYLQNLTLVIMLITLLTFINMIFLFQCQDTQTAFALNKVNVQCSPCSMDLAELDLSRGKADGGQGAVYPVMRSMLLMR